MTEYVETVTPEGDLSSSILDVLTEGKPYVLIVTTIHEKNLDLRVEVGGGVSSPSFIRTILEKTLAALPDG